MDTTEIRRQLVKEINADAGDRATLEARYGQVWDTAELAADFEVDSFAAPFVIVRRKLDGQEGSLAFQHTPRLYFNFEPYN
jgi:hypothetical protein